MQKELDDYEVSSHFLTVCSIATPGYGCIECGTKTRWPQTAIDVLAASTCEFRNAGDQATATQLDNEVTSLREALVKASGLRRSA